MSLVREKYIKKGQNLSGTEKLKSLSQKTLQHYPQKVLKAIRKSNKMKKWFHLK